jgi:hypothetical protein
MTTFSRIAASLFVFSACALALLAAPSASAAPLFNVTLMPTALQFPAGGEGVLSVRFEGQSALLPGLQFDAQGGDIIAIELLNRIDATTAEGSVRVSRATPGDVRVTASFGGATLATGEARFVDLGSIDVTVTVAGDANAAARTWRYEVLNANGAVVDTVEVGTSGDALTAAKSTIGLPYGSYTVRQVLGNDTKLSCSAGDAFYAVTDPATGAVPVDLNAAAAPVRFAIAVCPGRPKLSFQAPIDVVQPSPQAGTTATEPPINEVRGVRSAGPGAANTPLPPQTGSGPAGAANSLSPLLLLVSVMLLAAPTAYAGARLSVARRR